MINNFLTSLLGLNIYVYGLGVVLTLLTFLFLYWRQLRKTALNEEKLMDAMFASGIVALIFGRTAYVLYDWQFFSDSVLKPILILNYPGVNEFFFFFSFFGYWLLYSRRKKIALSLIFRLLVPGIVLSRLLLALLSLLKEVSLANLILAATFLLFIGLYFLLTRVFKKEGLKKHVDLLLILYLIIPNFLVDFFKQGRVYFVELLPISWQQLPYLAVLIISLLYLVTKTLFKKK